MKRARVQNKLVVIIVIVVAVAWQIAYSTNSHNARKKLVVTAPLKEKIQTQAARLVTLKIELDLSLHQVPGLKETVDFRLKDLKIAEDRNHAQKASKTYSSIE